MSPKCKSGCKFQVPNSKDQRTDYSTAGTQIVWDVDVLTLDIIRAYKATSPDFEVFRRGDLANAESVVPGWTLAVDDLFPFYTE